MNDTLRLLRFLIEKARSGERTALVTITDVTGSSSRAPGTQLVVSQAGAFLGSLSGGCVEAAVVAEARQAIATDRATSLRLGQGSPYIDLRLPCGGGMDVSIVPEPALPVLEQAHARLSARLETGISLGRDGALGLLPDPASVETGWDGDGFLVRYDPVLRVVIIGSGAETTALTSLAIAFGAEVEVFSPADAVLAYAEREGATVCRLSVPGPAASLRADPQTAIVMLFHDHDWETELLAQCLGQEAFFVGAMGSRRTHEVRTRKLLDLGVPRPLLDRLTAPLGLIPSTRDPASLALSTLSHIVSAHHASRRKRERPGLVPVRSE